MPSYDNPFENYNQPPAPQGYNPNVQPYPNADPWSQQSNQSPFVGFGQEAQGSNNPNLHAGFGSPEDSFAVPPIDVTQVAGKQSWGERRAAKKAAKAHAAEAPPTYGQPPEQPRGFGMPPAASYNDAPTPSWGQETTVPSWSQEVAIPSWGQEVAVPLQPEAISGTRGDRIKDALLKATEYGSARFAELPPEAQAGVRNIGGEALSGALDGAGGYLKDRYIKENGKPRIVRGARDFVTGNLGAVGAKAVRKGLQGGLAGAREGLDQTRSELTDMHPGAARALEVGQKGYDAWSQHY